MKPKLDILHLASFASLGTALTAAITKVSISKLSKTEHPIAILFYFNLFIGMLSLLPCIYSWKNIPSLYYLDFWFPFIFISLFNVLFHYSVIRACNLIPLHVVGNFTYFVVLFGAFFGWLIWKETLSTAQIFGGALLMGSGLLLIRENERKTSLGLTD